MADNKEKPVGWFGFAVAFVSSLSFSNPFLGHNPPSPENDQNGDSSGRELSSTQSKNDFVAIEVLQDSLQYLEKQESFDDGSHSIDINGSNSFSSRTETSSLPDQAWSVDEEELSTCQELVSSKLENTSYSRSESSSSSQRRRKVKLDMGSTITNASTMIRSQKFHLSAEQKEADKNHGKDNEGNIIKTLRNNELALPVMMASFTLLFGLLTFHKLSDMNSGMIIFMQLLFIAAAGLFIGIALQEIYPVFSDKIKLVGYGCFFFGFFGKMASFLGFYLGVIPITCAIFIIVLLLMALLNIL